jgi:hypothetical protein
LLSVQRDYSVVRFIPLLYIYGIKTGETMIKALGILGLLVLSFLISGCANWALKERCEKTNWFEYARDVANGGNYLEEDAFIKECKGLDRINSQQIDIGFKLGREKMCSYDEIYTRGKSGTPVFFKFCDGLQPQLMKSKHEEGLRIFCRRENGYPVGKSGSIYQNLCKPQEDKTFVPEYLRGRKDYLTGMIASLESRAAQLRADQDTLLIRESQNSTNLNKIPDLLDCQNKSVYDESSKKEVSKLVCQEPYYIKTQRGQLIDQLNEIRQSLRQTQINLNATELQLSHTQQDLTKLPQ